MSADPDISKQVEYWRRSAKEDMSAASELIKADHIRHGMFFLHLALEKALKSCVSIKIRDIPPRIHDLIRLADIAGIHLNKEQIDFLAEMNAFNLEGRYPEYDIPRITHSQAYDYLTLCLEFIEWLTNRS